MNNLTGGASLMITFRADWTEYLRDLTLDGTYPDTGHVDSMIGHVTLVAADADAPCPSGWYTLTESSDGTLSAVRYHDETAARDAFENIDCAYGEWLALDEDVA